MLWVKAFHLIAMVAWFSGLFYLPRLFVYHASTTDAIGLERFKVMERRLYYGIMSPAALATILLGLWLVSFNPSGYFAAKWFEIKLVLVACVLTYHLYLGHLRKQFAQDKNTHTALFYRIYNEIAVLFLAAIVILAVVKP